MRRMSLFLYFLLSSFFIPLQASIWTIDIDESPAPPPDTGPPFSAHAIRNPARLAAQVTGIVAAYLATALIIGTLLMTIGKRLRDEALNPKLGSAVEMTKLPRQIFESPISPSDSHRPWYYPRRLVRNRSMSNSMRSANDIRNAGLESMASFDATVLEADKQQRQDELERLYAAVMNHEEELQKAASSSQVHIVPHLDEEDDDIESPIAAESKYPPRLVVDPSTGSGYQRNEHTSLSQSLPNPDSPVSQRTPVRAIYPPDQYLSSIRPSAGSPIAAEYADMQTVLDSKAARPSTAERHNLFGRTHTSGSSKGSQRSRIKRSLKQISIDVPRPLFGPKVDSDSANTPLAPGLNGVADHTTSPQSEGPSTPGTYYSPMRGPEEGGHGSEVSRNVTPDVVQSSEPRGPCVQLPSLAQGKAVSTTKPGLPIPQSPRPPLRSNASNATLGSLPFRNTSSNNHGLLSPGMVTKTTYVERRTNLNGPRTGVATPYSPYMPFTPLTPVTPRLMSRQERRQMERDRGRRVLAEGDQVIDENQMWG